MMPHPPAYETAPLSPSQKAESKQLIEEGLRIPAIAPQQPTAFKDPTPPQPTGAQPVPQPDTRVVPQWATGIAVASTSFGLMSVGIGLASKLVLDSVTSEGVVMVGVVIGGAVALVGALCRLVTKLKEATPQPINNHFTGDTKIENTTHVSTTNKALSFQRTHVR